MNDCQLRILASLLFTAGFVLIESFAWNWFRPRSVPWKVCNATLLTAALAWIGYEIRQWNTLDPATVPIRVDILFFRPVALFCGATALLRAVAAWAPPLRALRRPRLLQFLATLSAFAIYAIYGRALSGSFLPVESILLVLHGEWCVLSALACLGIAAMIGVLRTDGIARRWRVVLATICLLPATLAGGVMIVDKLVPEWFSGTIHTYEYANGLVFESINNETSIAQLTVTAEFFTAPGAALVITAAGEVVKLPGATPVTLEHLGFEKSETLGDWSLSEGDPGNGGWIIRIRYDNGRLGNVNIRGIRPPAELIRGGAAVKIPRTVSEMKQSFGAPAAVTQTPFI